MSHFNSAHFASTHFTSTHFSPLTLSRPLGGGTSTNRAQNSTPSIDSRREVAHNWDDTDLISLLAFKFFFD